MKILGLYLPAYHKDKINDIAGLRIICVSEKDVYKIRG